MNSSGGSCNSRDCTISFVFGERKERPPLRPTLFLLDHCSIAARSYMNPSAATTGSAKNCNVIGQVNSSRAPLPPQSRCDLLIGGGGGGILLLLLVLVLFRSSSSRIYLYIIPVASSWFVHGMAGEASSSHSRVTDQFWPLSTSGRPRSVSSCRRPRPSLMGPVYRRVMAAAPSPEGSCQVKV
jgi:hypothetical protein